LGMNVNGETLAAPIWANLMNQYNQGLPQKNFPRPTGIVDGTVCRESGLLPRSACPTAVTLHFLAGTIPTEYCDRHGVSLDSLPEGLKNWRGSYGDNSYNSFEMPDIPEELRWIFEGGSRASSVRKDDENEEDPEVPSNYDPLLD